MLLSGVLGSGGLGSFGLGAGEEGGGGAEIETNGVNFIDLAQEASAVIVGNEHAGNTLNLTQKAKVLRRWVVSAESVLDLSVEATKGVYTVEALNQIALTSAATRARSSNQFASSALLLSDRGHCRTNFAHATSALAITHTIHVTRPWYATATSPIEVTQLQFDIPTQTIINVFVSGLSQAATVKTSITHRVKSNIPLTQVANGYVLRADAISVDAENSLTLDQRAVLSKLLDASSAISLTDAATGVKRGTDVGNELVLDCTASASISRANLALESVLDLVQTVRYVLEKSSADCLYTPFVGSTTDPNAPTPPPSTLPAASELTGFRLLFPSSGSPTDEIVLRAPNLGDIDRLAFDRINRETRGGTLVVFADPIWPKIETLVLQFSVLQKEEAYNLLTFMESHLGRKIRLIDWEHRAWTGYIINPQDPIVEDRRNSFTASFEFEGTRE